MSLFEKGKAIRRIEFREDLRRAPYRNPHSEGRRLSESERMGLEKELENLLREKGIKGLGDSNYIYRENYQRAVKELERTKYSRRIGLKEKAEIERKIRFLKELGEIK